MNRKSRNDSTTTGWAPLYESPRTRWIAIECVARTRRGAKELWLEGVEPEHHKHLLRGVRFVRVTITEQQPADLCARGGES